MSDEQATPTTGGAPDAGAPAPLTPYQEAVQAVTSSQAAWAAATHRLSAEIQHPDIRPEVKLALVDHLDAAHEFLQAVVRLVEAGGR